MRNQLSSIPFELKQEDLSLIVSSSEAPLLDSAVKEAVTTCNQSGTVSEILKLELKTKIQLRRHEKGIDLSFEEKPAQIEYKLTPEDLERRKELRERNKLSARKHREMKKEQKRQMEKEAQQLAEKNYFLHRKVDELQLIKNKSLSLLGISSEGEAV